MSDQLRTIIENMASNLGWKLKPKVEKGCWMSVFPILDVYQPRFKCEWEDSNMTRVNGDVKILQQFCETGKNASFVVTTFYDDGDEDELEEGDFLCVKHTIWNLNYYGAKDLNE